MWVDIGGTDSGEGAAGVWAERTLNILLMSMTLDESKLSC